LFALLKSSPSLRRLFGAQLQSELGTSAAYVALVLVAYHRLHSAWAIALVLLADFVPGIVLAVPFGALADQFSRKRLVVGGDLLRAAAFVALAAIPSFAATVGFALIAGVGTALFRPAFNAALPGMVSDEQRSTVTAIYSANFSIGTTVGPGLTALVLLFGPPTLMLALNGATFLVSAALLSTVSLASGAASRGAPDPDPAPEPEPALDPEPPAPERERESAWAATIEGARTAARLPGVGALLMIATGTVLASSLMNVAEPLLATGPLHAGSSGYSMLVAIFGAGMVAGTFLNAQAGSLVSGLRRRFIVGLALQSVAMIGSATAPNLAWAMASFALTGFANVIIVGQEIRLFQELGGNEVLGGVFGLRDMLSNVAFVMAFVTASLVLGAAGVRAVFALGGVGLGVLALAACLGLRPSRSGETVPVVPEPAVAA
jgi:MFS family permease